MRKVPTAAKAKALGSGRGVEENWIASRNMFTGGPGPNKAEKLRSSLSPANAEISPP